MAAIRNAPNCDSIAPIQPLPVGRVRVNSIECRCFAINMILLLYHGSSEIEYLGIMNLHVWCTRDFPQGTRASHGWTRRPILIVYLFVL
jgi:hypothetical protein